MAASRDQAQSRDVAVLEEAPPARRRHSSVTDVDLAHAQMRIASGEGLADLGLDQHSSTLLGAARQCRITTEKPTNLARPDTGKVATYRSRGGAGARLDGEAPSRSKAATCFSFWRSGSP